MKQGLRNLVELCERIQNFDGTINRFDSFITFNRFGVDVASQRHEVKAKRQCWAGIAFVWCECDLPVFMV